MTWVIAIVTLVVTATLVWLLLRRGSREDELKANLKTSPERTQRGERQKSLASESLSSPSKKTGAIDNKKTGPSDKNPASIAPSPLSIPPPPNDFDNEWDDIDVTLVGEMPEEIRALQKGYRAVDPKQAVAQVIKEAYDDTAEIEVVEERMVDGLLVEELLNDEDTGPHALVLPEGDVQTDRGRRRPDNEDRPICLPEHFVFGVADGMGGHAAGEVASQLAVDAIAQAFQEEKFEGEPNNMWPRRGDELARTIEMANRAIYEAACEDDALTGMGTTITAIRFCPERQRAYIAHVGDSRCYRIRKGELLQLTRDHTLGVELGAKGKMATHLSRSVGIAETVAVDLMVDAPMVGDRYVLCTDGLTKMMTEDRMVDLA